MVRDEDMEENLENEGRVKVSIPSWGEVVQSEGGLVISDDEGLLETTSVDASEKTSEKLQTTADTLEFLSTLTEQELDVDLNFLYDTESEDILGDIFDETLKQQMELDAILGITKVKSTGLTLDLVDELRKASPKSFNKKHVINEVEEKLINIENEKDLFDLLIVMSRHKDEAQGKVPDYIEEERRRQQILEQQRLLEEEERRRREEEQRRLERQRELEAQRLRDEEARQRELDRLEKLRLELELQNSEDEDEPVIELVEIEDDGSDILEEVKIKKESVLPTPELYEETLETYETELEDFSEDESLTYSLKKLKKTHIIPEDTIL